MRLVIIESPYGGDVETNTQYARSALADCLSRGEAPIASHLLYTQPGVLRDEVRAERALGIAAGHAWYQVAEACIVYTDLGITSGMEQGLTAARLADVPIEYRQLPFWLK